MQQLLVSPTELAQLIGLAPRTIYNRIHTGGDLPPVLRIGRLPRFAIVDVQAWVDAKRGISAPAPAVEPHRRRPGRPTKAEQVASRGRA